MDYNRERLYTAERVAWRAAWSKDGPPPPWQRLLTHSELVSYLAHLLALGGAKHATVRVRPQRARGAAYHGFIQGAHEFSFSRRLAVAWVAVHEVAHALNGDVRRATTKNRAPWESHGPEFCAAYIRLAGLEFGTKAADHLAVALDAGGCRTTQRPLYVYEVSWADDPYGEVRRVVTTTPHRAARTAWCCTRTEPGIRIRRLGPWQGPRMEGRLVRQEDGSWIPRGY